MRIFFTLLLAIGLYANAATEAAKKLGYFANYEEGLQKAKQKNKDVMLLVVQDGCHWCKKFERTTLKNKEVQEKISSYVKIVVDKEDVAGTRFESKFFPMVYFVDTKTDKILSTSYGYRTKSLFLEDIAQASKKGK